MIRMYRYCEGDDAFMMIDGRDADILRFRRPDYIHAACLMQQVSGVVILDHSAVADFKMEVYGDAAVPDGAAADSAAFVTDSAAAANLKPSGTLSKAAACAVAFADLLGIKAFNAHDYSYEYCGSTHRVFIDSHLGECKLVRLGDTVFTTLCLGPVE